MKIFLLIITVIHSLILSKLIYFPYPEFFIYPYLTNHGLKPYQQILDQHFPGLMFLPINFNNLGMTDALTSRIWLISIVILTHFFLFYISKDLLKSAKKAILVNVLFLVWQPFFEGWVFWIDSILPLILLPSFYALYRNKYFLTGLLLGLGVIFKQTLIPLSLLVLIYVFWESRKIKQATTYLAGLGIPVILMLGYIIFIGVLKDFWYWTVAFNLTTYAKSGTSFPDSLGFVTRVLLVYLPAFLFLFTKQKKLISALFIFLIGSLIGVFDRANFIHYQPSLPFALVATSAGVYQLFSYRYIKIFTLIYIFITIWWQGVFYKGHISSKILFFDEQTQLLASKIRQLTIANEKIFVFGAVPHLYQMSSTLPAGDVFVFQFPWFLEIAEERLLQGLIKDEPKIIVSDRTVVVDEIPITKFGNRIDQYIQENYQVIDRVGVTDILRRRTN